MLEYLAPLLPLWGICEYPQDLPPLARPGRLPGGACRVIAAAFPYRLPEEYYAGRNISRYAVGIDYHAVCGQRLERACALLRAAYPGEEFAWFCDSWVRNSPVDSFSQNALAFPLPEVELAQRAGMGVRGKNNLLITEEYGTWVFLGEIATTAPLPLTVLTPLPHPCEGCAAPCRRACPTGALSAQAFVPEKCISAVTQRKGVLSLEEERQLIRAQSAWGCDLCQEACLANQNARIDPLPEFLSGAVARVTAQTPVAGRAYAWRGEKTIRRNVGIISRSG